MKPWMTKITIALIFVMSAIVGLYLSWKFHRFTPPPPPNAPAGAVTIKTFHYPLSFIQQIKHDPHAGADIYHEYCHSCHAPQPIIPVHAPRVTDKASWLSLDKMGMKQLLKYAANGLAAMPARGGCFECSDHELVLAIRYMSNRATHNHPIKNN